jgi:hypothetical protein
MPNYIAVERSPYLCHVNRIHGRHGWFGRGDGDGDGIVDDHHNQKKSEYSTSSRRSSDSQEARDRLDAYYKNLGEDENYTTKTGPSTRSRSANPYVDKDGNLTKAGESRWESEKRRNQQKPKDKRVNEDALLDPNKWLSDDIKTLTDLARAKKAVDNEAKSITDMIFKSKNKPKRLDLSKMSDNEIRSAINRELIEKQYNDLFNKPKEDQIETFVKGAEKVHDFITDQAILGLTIAGLIVALAR